MSTLLIAYDLADPAATKPALVAEIMAIGEAWARPLDTVWYVRTECSCSEVTAALAPLIGADDGLVVQPAPTEARLANTRLRWFRPRRPPEQTGHSPRDNVVRLHREGQAAAFAGDDKMSAAPLRAAS